MLDFLSSLRELRDECAGTLEITQPTAQHHFFRRRLVSAVCWRVQFTISWSAVTVHGAQHRAYLSQGWLAARADESILQGATPQLLDYRDVVR